MKIVTITLPEDIYNGHFEHGDLDNLDYTLKGNLKENWYYDSFNNRWFGDPYNYLNDYNSEMGNQKLIFPKGSVFYYNEHMNCWIPENYPNFEISDWSIDSIQFTDEDFDNIEPFNPITRMTVGGKSKWIKKCTKKQKT